MSDTPPDSPMHGSKRDEGKWGEPVGTHGGDAQRAASSMAA